jgi:hypothetical protein
MTMMSMPPTRNTIDGPVVLDLAAHRAIGDEPAAGQANHLARIGERPTIEGSVLPPR